MYIDNIQYYYKIYLNILFEFQLGIMVLYCFKMNLVIWMLKVKKLYNLFDEKVGNFQIF